MAATLDELYLEPFVYSPMNLAAFLKWATTASEADLDRAFETVYIVDHRMDEDIFGEVPVMPVIIQRADLNITWEMPHVECTEVGCQRCESGRGGYQFRWVGPWTCCATIGDEYTTPHELYERAFLCRFRLQP